MPPVVPLAAPPRAALGGRPVPVAEAEPRQVDYLNGGVIVVNGPDDAVVRGPPPLQSDDGEDGGYASGGGGGGGGGGGEGEEEGTTGPLIGSPYGKVVQPLRVRAMWRPDRSRSRSQHPTPGWASPSRNSIAGVSTRSERGGGGGGTDVASPRPRARSRTARRGHGSPRSRKRKEPVEGVGTTTPPVSAADIQKMMEDVVERARQVGCHVL